jgi:hypothetical protein
MKMYPMLFIFIILSGCAMLKQPSTPNNSNDTAIKTEASLPETFQLHDVPHNPRRQEGTDCAPDSLRMVLNYRGKDVSKDWDIPQQLTSDLTGLRGSSGGTSFGQMQRIAAEVYKLPAFLIYNCDLQSMKALIMSKWPPIVTYRIAGKAYHAVVAVGFDDKRRNLLVHDPNFAGVSKIRYSDLGGLENDSVQRVSCLLVLPEGSTEMDLQNGLEKYVPKDVISKLTVSVMFPQQKANN